MVLGVIFSLLGIGMLVTLMFNLAILALPFLAAVTAGRLAYDTGAGVLGAVAVGFVAGAAALAAGQVILVLTRSTVIRFAVALAFTAPAAFAGYHLVLSHVGGAHGIWQEIFAAIGSIVIGVAALIRLATPMISPTPPTRTA